MEEKQGKKEEFKGKMGIVWLTGILVIILGCVTVYTFKLVNENKKLKQAPAQVQQTQTVATQEQAKPQTTAKEEKTEETNTTSTQEKTTYTFENLEGVYVYKEKVEMGGKIAYNNHILELYKDGTYDYSNGIDIEGHIGNYIIKDNKIILNAWFSYGSDIGRFYSDKSVTYNINIDGSIGNMKKSERDLNNKTGKQSVKSAIQENAISIE